MGQITSLFLRKLVTVVDESVDTAGILRAAGIALDDPIDPKFMLAADDYYALFEQLAKADPNGITLPLRVGNSMRCDDYGALGLAWKSAKNLAGSVDRSYRYARVLTSVATYELEKVKQGGLIHLYRGGERSLGMRLSNEATIASLASMSREVAAQPFQPLAIYFKHNAPASIAFHELHFGCPVYFSSDKDAILVSGETLQIPNKLGDDAISRFFDTHLEAELAKLEDDGGLDKRVKIQLSQALSEGVPSIN
ncbi:MAG: AraC family transcriptional regulator, partial [Pseudomonadota bacterium]